MKNSKKSYYLSFAFLLVFSLVSLSFFLKQQENNNLGTFKSPKEAFIETHKALSLVSEEINFGMENVIYTDEYNKTKKLIFKTQK